LCPVCLLASAVGPGFTFAEPGTRTLSEPTRETVERDNFGPYRILTVLSEGGMGRVYPDEPGSFSVIPADERIWLAHRLMLLNARDDEDQSRISRYWWNMLSEDGSYMLPQDIFDRAL
jgi:hypothetical protein